MLNKGLRKYQIENILREKLEKDPDLKYYIDNDYITKLVELLIEGIGEAIEKNNKELVDNLLRR